MIGRRNSGSDEALETETIKGDGVITKCSTISERHFSNHSIDQGSCQRCPKDRGYKGREIGKSNGRDREVIWRSREYLRKGDRDADKPRDAGCEEKGCPQHCWRGEHGEGSKYGIQE